VRRLFTSTIARLVAAIFLVQVLSSTAAISLLRVQMLQVVQSDRARQVLDLRDDLLAAYYEGGRDRLAQTIEEERGGVADPLVFVGLTGSGTTVSSNLATVPSVIPDGALHAVQIRDPGAQVETEGLAIGALLSDGSRLVVGSSAAPDRGFDIAFAEALGLTVLLTGLLALGASLLVGFAISRRTHALAETAEALAAGDFAVRLPQEQRGDGFDHLRQQMNLMAERIGSLLEELHSVSSALAHDLKSPVARLRASIDTAMVAVEPGPGLEALQLARSDAEALESMLSTALELNRLESGAFPDRRTAIDLDEVARDLVELYEPLADQSGITLAAETVSVRILADREMLSRALANLIDNSLKYGGDQVIVAVRKEQTSAILAVSDNGPGIGQDDLHRATGHFVRLDNARTSPGAGLGLAMVAAVARLHGGALELSRRNDGASGLVASMRLPLG
jgi:signal transduction histidine kinase